jgi:hypothetical protein
MGLKCVLLLSVVALPSIVGCDYMAQARDADQKVEALDKRMKQIEKDAKNTNDVHSRRDSSPE